MNFLRAIVLLFPLILAGCAGTGPVHRDLTTNLRLHLANVAESQGNMTEALAILSHAAARWPGKVAVQKAYARALLKNNQVMAARNVMSRIAARHPGDRALERQVGVIDIDAGNEHLGVGIFDHLLATGPRDWRTMVDKGVALDIAHRHVAAQRLYCQALTLSPHPAGVATDLAMSLMLQGRLGEARTILDPYFVRYDTSRKTRDDLAVLYQATGETNRVKQLLTSATQRQEIAELALHLPTKTTSAGGKVCD
jgi:Flp pilus assembly protein TadD